MSDIGNPGPGITRKLTTIFHADVCGYSRLMEQDEIGTLNTLKDCKGVVASFLGRHQGRVINWTGDGLLAEFASVVEAVQCAVEIQRELTARNDLLDGDRRMDFRIGINLGDVMVDNNELFGEGVNIAARLQSIAPVGGILLSGTAFDQVYNKLALEFDFMGRQSVKNIRQEIPAYIVVLDPNAPVTSRRVSKSTRSFDDLRATIGASTESSVGARDEEFEGEIHPGPYAGFWKRSVAFTVDWCMGMTACAILADITSNENLLALQAPVYLLYMTAFESGPWQSSVGKKIMGIRVIDQYGHRLTFVRALGRNAAKGLSFMTLLFGFAMAGWSKRKQGLHDRLAETLLIDEDALADAQDRPQKLWS